MRSFLLACLTLGAAVTSARAADVDQIVAETGICGGIAVQIGVEDVDALVKLQEKTGCTVQGLDADATSVATARAALVERGLNGPVSVALLEGHRLPYIDNLVNLIVVDEAGALTRDEILRVVAPLGTAWIAGQRIVKPWPAAMDEWPQYLHGADNNAVSEDTLVGPPRHLQWVSDPAWSRSHMTIPTVNSMVTARGRLFTIEDRATPENPFLPGRFSLVARDAFNGTVLWEHAFDEWESITRYVKDIAVQLQRRLAAIDDRVYCTPSLHAPLTVFDARTGKVLDEYENTRETQEFVVADGVVYAVIGDRANAGGVNYDNVKTYSGKGTSFGGTDPSAPFDGTGFAGAYTPEFVDRDHTFCRIAAIETATGIVLWTAPEVIDYVPASLAVKEGKAVYMTQNGLVCVDAKSGTPVWTVEKAMKSDNGTQSNVLVISGSTVYTAEGAKDMGAYSLADGHERWSGTARKNYEKTADLFVLGGAPWTAGAGQPTRHDPESGQEIEVLEQIMQGPMGHDRCYRNFITTKYFINSKTGGADFVEIDTGQEFPNHWLRGTCGMGTMPANGLLYAPPYSCQCSMGAMIKNFNALATEPNLATPDQPIPVAREVRLVRGPAWGQPLAASTADAPWPTHRSDNARSGRTDTPLPTELVEQWRTPLPGATPSAMTMAEGKLFLADVDVHAVYALSAADGAPLWTYAAGARVDSPPTYYRGRLYFGSRDGWVHCITAASGMLVWRFKDLPEKTVAAFGQLESAWPVCGSVTIERDTVYFSAGRSSFLDGGMFLYGLDPETGQIRHDQAIYGPFDEEHGFPLTRSANATAGLDGFKGDILVTDGQLVYLRHRAFEPDLTVSRESRPHLMPSAGFVDSVPQHRTYWTVSTRFDWNKIGGIDCDILVIDGDTAFGVQGFPTIRHSYFDPRKDGYRLFATSIAQANQPAEAGKGKAKRQPKEVVDLWSAGIPLTGKAMAKAGDTLCIAGTPMQFADNPWERYVESYEQRLGGVLWLASAQDGSRRAEYTLDAAPRWDAMIAAEGRIYLALNDGTVRCLGAP